MNDTAKSALADAPVERQGLAAWHEIMDRIFVHFDFHAPSTDEFSGFVRKNDVGPLCVYEIEASPHTVTRSAEHLLYGEAPMTIVTLVERGDYRVTHDEQTYLPTSSSGDIFVLHSTWPFQLNFTSSVKCWVIASPAIKLKRELLSSARLTGVPVSGAAGVGRVLWSLLQSVIDQLPEMTGTEREHMSDMLLLSLNVMAGALLRASGVTPHTTKDFTIDRVKLYIRENLKNPDLKAGKVANDLGISQRYMNKLFSSEGVTVGKLIMTSRLDGAKHDLQNALKCDKSITDIAFDWGFNSISHFSRVFHQQFGITPRDAKLLAQPQDG